ncbi:MAG TPA: hypothetical protein VM389_00385 [Phycisphaerae bacterium]|nr:hypothetical protein [Phycisphaerae bacterium]
MEEMIDPRAYSTVPMFDVRAGVALGRAVLTAAPAATNPIVGRELDRLGSALGALEAAWQPVAADPAPASDRRPADNAVDGAWGGMHARLQAWERLPGDAHPEVARAEAIRGALFPDGLAFLTLPYDRQWAESQRRLDHIDAGSLAADIDSLCAPAFLAAVRTAHARYGIVLGITEVAPEPAEVQASLREPFAAFRAALSRYVMKLVGTLDDEDPAAVRAVKAALRPLDDFRAAAAARAQGRPAAPAAQAAEAPAT